MRIAINEMPLLIHNSTTEVVNYCNDKRHHLGIRGKKREQHAKKRHVWIVVMSTCIIQHHQ